MNIQQGERPRLMTTLEDIVRSMHGSFEYEKFKFVVVDGNHCGLTVPKDNYLCMNLESNALRVLNKLTSVAKIDVTVRWNYT